MARFFLNTISKLALCILSSCTLIENECAQAGFSKEIMQAGNFKLVTFQRCQTSTMIRIYIEGDGKAWLSKNRLSSDPTPAKPIALQLAALDPSESVAYIARPGQFGASSNAKYWAGSRFAPEVVEAISQIIDRCKDQAHANRVELIGFSGGAALVILVASSRDDVASIRTIAGNLSSRQLCDDHHVSQLNDSLDPINVAQAVAHIPQRHFIARNDRIVPAAIAQSFVQRAGGNDSWITSVDATHNNGWIDQWSKLLSLPLSK